MSVTNSTLGLKVEVLTEEREGYFAASTNPFAITVYGETEDEAEKRALDAVILLLNNYLSTHKQLSDYLNRMGVKHSIVDYKINRRQVVRESKREIRLEAPAGV